MRHQPSNAQALVIVTVEFDGPSEGLTFTILIPSDPDEGVIREQAIARAQKLAKGFASQGPLTARALKLPEFCKTPLTL